MTLVDAAVVAGAPAAPRQIPLTRRPPRPAQAADAVEVD